MHPEIMMDMIEKFFKKNFGLILLILFLLVDVFFSVLLQQNNSLQRKEISSCTQEVNFLQNSSFQKYPFANIPKLSEINGPRIDDGAAAIKRIDSFGMETTCQTLPVEIWLFLLFAYASLLIFNLTYTFKNAVKIQWFWESLYTLLALVAWFVWDNCAGANLWYLEFVLKTGIVIYGTYFYKKVKSQNVKMSEHR